MSEKTEVELLKEKLFANRKNGRGAATQSTLAAADDFAESYKSFLNSAKTEREAVKSAIAIAQKNGYTEYVPGKKYTAGQRYFVNNRGKTLALVNVGELPANAGLRVTAAHVDSPRLDLKPNPLYEELELALLKTHYYGGIRKYQWPTVPLSLHGVIAKADGSTVTVNIGEDDADPKFIVNDLLPHLAVEQAKRTLADGIRGEELNVLIGSHPFKSDSGSELVKLNILKILNEKYGIVESDFVSAELECVPALKACDIGLDRSMVGGYGQDDRVCAYPALMAAVNTKNPQHTLVTILTDKEEIGSEGNTGLNSTFVKYIVRDICNMQNADYTVALRNSKCLSADVNAGTDPTFQDVMESRNAPYLNYGVCITKYTGARGKYDTNDASAEYFGFIRNMLNNAGVVWQTGELGKVDNGGGGTVAKYLAMLGMDVIDLGVPVLSMHSPFETTAKFDIYMAYLAMFEFAK